MAKVWSVGVFSEDENYGIEKELSNPIKVFDAKKIRKNRRHVHTYADPFLFVHVDYLYIFLEVQEIGDKGSINAWRTKDLLEWSDLGCILKEPFHLSYPLIFEDKVSQKIYLLPETSEEKKIFLYEFESFPGKLKWKGVIMEGNYADSNLLYHGGVYYLSSLDQDKNQYKLFYADQLDGPWQEHPSSPVNTSFPRNGGGFFKDGGRLFRAAQNTSQQYGGGIVILEVTALTKTTYAEKPVAPDLKPAADPSWQKKGRHHFSIKDFKDRKIITIDGLQEDFMINKLLNFLFKII
jgi:hypothetical protein